MFQTQSCVAAKKGFSNNGVSPFFTIPPHPILPLGRVMFQSDVDHSPPSQDMLNQVTPPKLLGTHPVPESDRICACLE